MDIKYKDYTITVNRMQYPLDNGGQHVLRVNSGVVASCEELEIIVSIECHRSQMRNQDLAVTLVQLAIDDYIK